MPSEPDEVSHEPLRPHAPDGVARLFESALEADLPEQPGACIGPYKLLERIGEGGFGVVWMAEQHEPIRRRVALKIIKSGMDTREVIARFEAERQALALMDHPNIARVLDAGATDTGRPYFVMELVRGTAITRYCNEHRLGTEARLRLFISVCQAVQHAHQKGIIHRDLKPSNILVTLHDGVPVPKVIDFGIAKATGERLTDKTLFTRFHAFIGTPAYTSPEQIEMSGLDVDTRSDIYSLGVLLYEMLAGHPPFNAQALLRSGIEAMRKTIRHVDPPRPSHRLATLTDDERSTVAHAQGTDIARLSLLLRGDLDWIVMRCLEKDRNRRYETANGLARDIERHLASEPVVARPPSAGYRLRKFIRRHKAAVAATSAVVLALVAGLLASSILLVREHAARSRATEAEHREIRLRHEAEVAKDLEAKRASRTAIALADQLLEEGDAADALAYLVHATRKDPANTVLGSRIASVLTSHNFLVPLGAPLHTGARVIAMRYSLDGAILIAATEDGIVHEIDAASGAIHRQTDLGKRIRPDGVAFPELDDSIFAVRFEDDSIAVHELGSHRPRWAPVWLEGKVLATLGLWMLGPPVLMSPDGRFLLARSFGEFWLWDAGTGEQRLHLSFNGYVNGPAFSPDGSMFVLVSEETARVWGLPDCKPVLEPLRIDRLPSNRGRRIIPSFSPDGRRLALCDTWEGTEVFDTRTGEKLIDSRVGLGAIPQSTRFLPDGRFFVSHTVRGRMSDLDTGVVTSIGMAFAFTDRILPSEDGRYLLATTSEGLLRIWDLKTGGQTTVPTHHQDDPFCVAITPDSRQVAIGTASGRIFRLHLNESSAMPLELSGTSRAIEVRFDKDTSARVLRMEEAGLRVADTTTGRDLTAEFARASEGDVGHSDPIVPNLIDDEAIRFAVHPGFTFVAVRHGHREREALEHIGTRFVRRIPLEDAEDSGVGVGWVFSIAGDLVAQASRLGIHTWDLKTGRLAGPALRYKDLTVCSYPGYEFSPDGRRIAGGVENGEIVVWDVATGETLLVIETGSDGVSEEVHFTPDGSRIISTDWRRRTRVWDSLTGAPLSPVLESSDANGNTISEDGSRFAIHGRHTTTIYDTTTGAPVTGTLPIGADEVQFSRDSRLVALTQHFSETRLIDVATGQKFAETLPQPSQAAAHFSPDGRFLAVHRLRDDIAIYSIPPRIDAPVPEWLLDLASAIATREIAEGERCVDAPQAVERIDDIRRELASLPADAPFVEWGRWILDASPGRPIAPGFAITPKEVSRHAMQAAGPSP